MKKLTELLNLDRQDGTFGIEIEVEGRNLLNIQDNYWVSEADNSLRNGIEYVMKKPVKLQYVKKLLAYLKKKLEANQSVLEFSFRTSVHVHVNVQDLTYNQILNMIYTYLLIEAPLMDFCGESRKGNRFCLRIEDAEGMVEMLRELFRMGEGGLRRIPRDNMRYAAINIEALSKYGSLEFRALQGNLDVDRITTWCKILNKIKEFAIKFDNPSDIFTFYTQKEADAFFYSVLEEEAKDLYSQETTRSIQRNFSLTLDLPFAYTEGKNRDIPIAIAKVDWGAPEAAPFKRIIINKRQIPNPLPAVLFQ